MSHGTCSRVNASRAAPILLVVDGDPRTVEMARDLWPSGTFDVRTAPRGELALDIVRREPVAVLVTEASLQGMDGLTLIRLARRERPELVSVVLTATPTAQGAVDALRLDAADYILKHRDTAAHLRDSVQRAVKRNVHRVETDRLLVELTQLNEHFLQSMSALQRENLELEAKVRPSTRQGFRMLIVDDDRTIVAVLESLLLSQSGIEVECAYSVEEARASLERGPFDLVLSDLHIGHSSGMDVLTFARGLTPPPAVVLMTGYASVETAIQAVEQGAQGYLTKPFNDLNVVLGRVLDTKEGVEQARKESTWLGEIRGRNADFIARYRLLKMKLATLQRDAPQPREQAQ